ncbi:MAG: DUF5687 family protein [Bacteroidota bacterium]
MLIKKFVRNEWLQTRRSSMWEQSMGIKVFLGIIFFLLFLELVAGSIILSVKFDEIFPDDDPVEKFNGYLLYGFGLGFLTRFIIQQVPVMSIQPYLHLPVSKPALVHYVLGKSLLSFFNFIPWVIFIPFVIFQIAPWFSSGAVAAYFLSILFTVLSVNFLSLLAKRNFSVNNWISGVIGVVIILLGVADYYELISVSSFSSHVFTAPLENPLWAAVPAVIAISVYLLNYTNLASHLYPADEKRRKKQIRKAPTQMRYLKNLGEMGELILLEIRLFRRNKRTKSTMYFLPVFLLYGFMFYPQEMYLNMYGWLLFVGIFMTGPILMLYGQYILSWESSYFDGILTHIDDFNRYFRAKYYIMVFSTIIAYIVTIPYAYFGIAILYINTAALLFNIGVSPIYILLMSANNRKRLDLSQGAAFNYQGVSATQFLISFPILLAPMFIYLPFWVSGNPMAGIIMIGLIGLIGFSFNKYFVNLAVKRFLNRRYLIAEGFRNKH